MAPQVSVAPDRVADPTDGRDREDDRDVQPVIRVADAPLLNRRRLVLGGAGVGLLVGKPLLDRAWLGPHVERAEGALARFARTPLAADDPLLRDLLAPERVVALSAGHRVAPRGELLLERTFVLAEDEAAGDEPSHVELVVVGLGAEVPSQHPLLLTVDDRRYLLPFLQGPQRTEASAYLRLKPGAYPFRLETLAATGPLWREAVRVGLRRVTGSRLQEAIWAGSPVYALLRANMADVPGFWRDQRSAGTGFERITATVDDMPTLGFCRLFRPDDGDGGAADGRGLVVEDMLVRMSENDGWTARQRLALGRTQDAEWSLRQRLTGEGEVMAEIVQGERHTPIRLRDPRFGRAVDDRRLLQIATANGNFSYDVRTDVFFAARRRLVPAGVTTRALAELNPILRYLGFREEAAAPRGRGLADGAARAEAVLAEMRRRPPPPYPAFPPVAGGSAG